MKRPVSLQALDYLARPAGFEPTAPWFVGGRKQLRRSINQCLAALANCANQPMTHKPVTANLSMSQPQADTTGPAEQSYANTKNGPPNFGTSSTQTTLKSVSGMEHFPGRALCHQPCRGRRHAINASVCAEKKGWENSVPQAGRPTPSRFPRMPRSASAAARGRVLLVQGLSRLALCAKHRQ